MNTAVASETTSNEILESNYALKIAFQTMKERCQQLQNRLSVVEKENAALRLECNKYIPVSLTDNKSSKQVTATSLQEKIDGLLKQKSQLTHHLVMVASENRQLWNRLIRLTQANKSLDNKDQSLEEISLKLKNSMFLEKSELEQQYADMIEIQSSSNLNIPSIGFTYPEDNDISSSDHIKHYESRLIQSKEALFIQNEKLKKIVKFFEKISKGKTCKKCSKNVPKKMCQVGTQVVMNEENNYTQTSLSAFDSNENSSAAKNNEENEPYICPLCGQDFGYTSFTIFHEHVLNHFALNGDALT